MTAQLSVDKLMSRQMAESNDGFFQKFLEFLSLWLEQLNLGCMLELWKNNIYNCKNDNDLC